MTRAPEILERRDPRLAADATALYDRDFAEWALAQAELIRTGRLRDLDIDNIAEEIESLGREQFAKVRSSMRIVLVHLLKWDHQPEYRTRSWALSIRDHQAKIEDVIELSPSLRRRGEEALEMAYRRARLRAADETGLRLSVFPSECPYSLDDILNRRVEWPED